ncbi:MAG: acyl-CoA mutase large subunit family protein [Desulfobacteraceae bacterium]
MFDPKTVEQDRKLKASWAEQFEVVKGKFMREGDHKAETYSGIPLKALYTPEDIAHISYSEIGMPGQFPFTRGNYPMGYQFMPWANQPVIGCGTPEETRARMDYLREQGMTGYFGKAFYNLVYDLATHGGFDPTDRAAEGRIGECGMSVYSKSTMEILFKDMPLDQMNVVHITMNQTLPILAIYIAYAESRRYTPDQLRGNSMNWYHTYNVASGLASFPPEVCDRLAAELIWFCTKNMPAWNTTNLFGYGIEEAGANAFEEIAVIVTAGMSVTRRCLELGLNPDDFLPRFGFQIAQGMDFFEEIAKIRALRKIWAKTNRDVFGAKKPQSMQVRIHTHTSGAMLTAQQPLVNLIRTTLQGFGAALSGVQAMEIPGYDEALAIPSEDAARLALRIQQVIAEETNITKVSDPLGGSYYVEWLTAEMEKKAKELIDTIEQKGGFVACWESGFIRSVIETSARKWKEAVDSGKKVVIGVNKYRMEEEQKIPVYKIDLETSRIQKERDLAYKANRDVKKHEQAMKALEEVLIRFKKGDNDHSLIPAMIEAARCDATNGEMMALMKETLGWLDSAVLAPC